MVAGDLERPLIMKPTTRIAIETETSDGWQILEKVNVRQ